MTSIADGEEIYEPVESNIKPEMDPQGYLVPYPDGKDNADLSPEDVNSRREEKAASGTVGGTRNREGIVSLYANLWDYVKRDNPSEHNMQLEDEPIYDEVNSVIPTIPGAKIIPIEEPVSAYQEVVINDGQYLIPSRQWDSDSDAFESDFDDESEYNGHFGEDLEDLYENLENRKLASPGQDTIPVDVMGDKNDTLKMAGGRNVLKDCLPFSFSKTSKNTEKTNGGEDSPLYVDPNSIGEKKPVMPPITLDLSGEEKTRYEIVNQILATEATYKDVLTQITQIEEELRERKILDAEKVDVIFCSVRTILQCHEIFSSELATRMNEWTVNDKLGDVICASFSTSATSMAYTDFVNNFPAAIDTYRAACKSHSLFSQFLQAKENVSKSRINFHALMLKPFARFPEFIMLIQDLLEVTPVSHADRVPLQLGLTQLECLAEMINLRRKESEMRSRLKNLDAQVVSLNKPLSSSGRTFIRQDDMVHCLIDGVSVVGTKKLRLVLLSDMLLCLAPVNKKKGIVSGFLSNSKPKFKLKWNVPLSDVEFVEYGAGVSVAASKYGTITTYSDQGKYRQASAEMQKHIEDLQHDLAVIGQIAGLASSLRGHHEFLDRGKVEQWYKSVENVITEELKAINMFWLELSLPTKSGQHNYVFNLSSPTLKEEWQAAATNAKLALETRNNPGWYLPDEDLNDGGTSILRRNMPLLAEFFDLFIFNAKSRVENIITYCVGSPRISSDTISRGRGHYAWISARGELQGHVSVLRFERNARVPRFQESFKVSSGTVYSMARIPAMNSRADQSAEKYHTKYGFPFPTVWLGSHSSRIYIYDAASEDRSRPLMELKLRDAPLAMRFAKNKIYVGLANGTLAIFRSNTGGHWNLVQPSILALGRYPVAVIADVKENLWCGSGSQIYIVSKRGDRIQRIIAVDTNTKSLVKHIVGYGIGVWVSVWRKATVKLYHAETFDMIQEINVVSPVAKMKSDVDSLVQYLSVSKISVTALLVIPGFLWVGTNLGLILLYPLPKMQGVPRVAGRACVAFHGHSGPVRCLFTIPQGELTEEAMSDDVTTADEDPSEINRQFSMLADSEESVESDEEFYFVDEKNPSPRRKKSIPRKIQSGSLVKVTMRTPQKVEGNSETTAGQEDGRSSDFMVTRPDDFARMMERFGGFYENDVKTAEKDDEKPGNKVRSFKNRLFVATHSESTEEGDGGSVCEEAPKLGGTTGPGAENPTIRSGKCKLNANGKGTNGVSKKRLSSDGHKIPDDKRSGTETSLVSPENTDISNDDISNNISTVGSQAVAMDRPDKHNAPEAVLPAEEKLNETDGGSDKQDLTEDADGDFPLYENFPISGDPFQNGDSTRNGISLSNAPEESTSKPGNFHVDEEGTRPDDLNERPSSGVAINENAAREKSDPCLSSTPHEKANDVYMTVLPNKPEQTDGNDVACERSGAENWFGESAKSSRKCLSHLVVSAGEGHVDLRLRVKSKQEIKKDSQSMFLIWRINSKV